MGKKGITFILSLFFLTNCSQSNIVSQVSDLRTPSSIDINDSQDGFSDSKNDQSIIGSQSLTGSSGTTSSEFDDEIKKWEDEGYICEGNLVYTNDYNDKKEYSIVGYYGKPKEIIIPDIFKGLPVGLIRGAFYNCQTLEKIHIGKNLRSISETSFENCISLKEITIDENNAVFFFDSGLLYARAKDSVLFTLIFCPCEVTGAITVLEETAYIQHGAFASYPKVNELHLGKNVDHIRANSTLIGLDYLNNITISNENTNYCSEDGVLFSKDKTELIFISPTRHTLYEIPESVGAIYGSFEKCTKLKDLTINSKIDRAYPLYCSTLENVYVDAQNECFKSVEGILYSKDLKEVIIVPPQKLNPSLVDSVEVIKEYAFLENINKKIVLPDAVRIIGDYAFPWHNKYLYNENIEEITFGNKVTKIGVCAFDGTINLKNVNYKGSQEEFSQIEILEYNDFLLNATINYNYSES